MRRVLLLLALVAALALADSPCGPESSAPSYLTCIGTYACLVGHFFGSSVLTQPYYPCYSQFTSCVALHSGSCSGTTWVSCSTNGRRRRRDAERNATAVDVERDVVAKRTPGSIPSPVDGSPGLAQGLTSLGFTYSESVVVNGTSIGATGFEGTSAMESDGQYFASLCTSTYGPNAAWACGGHAPTQTTNSGGDTRGKQKEYTISKSEMSIF